jgi:hypothetical protein
MFNELASVTFELKTISYLIDDLPGVNVINLFYFVTDTALKKPGVLVPGSKWIQVGLIFENNTKAYSSGLHSTSKLPALPQVFRPVCISWSLINTRA